LAPESDPIVAGNTIVAIANLWPCSGVAMAGSAGSRNLGPRPPGAPSPQSIFFFFCLTLLNTVQNHHCRLSENFKMRQIRNSKISFGSTIRLLLSTFSFQNLHDAVLKLLLLLQLLP
jgi:hypothetical protein